MLLDSSLVFFLIYDINFKFMPSVTTARIVLLYLFLTHFKNIPRIFKEFGGFGKVIVFLLFISLIQSLFSEDFTQFSRLLFFILYSLIASMIIVVRFNSKHRVLKSILYAISFQSLILIYGFFNPSLKTILNSFIIYGANFSSENLYRALGFSSASGAALSLIQSLGVAVGLLLLAEKEIKSREKLLIVFFIAINCISTIFIGRTGLLISLTCILIYMFYTLNFRKIVVYTVLISLFGFYSLKLSQIFTNELNAIEGFSSDYFVNWISSAFEVENNTTVNALLYKQNIPELTLELFFIGTGTIFKDGINTSGHDSGYIQTYYSLGMIWTIVFYCSLILFIMKKFKFIGKPKLALLCVIVLILEFKEPLLFKYAEGFVIFVVLFSYKFKLERQN